MSQTLVCTETNFGDDYSAPPGTPILEAISGDGFFLSSLDSALPLCPAKAAQAPQQTSSFLHIPHELRLQIYSLAIEAPTGYQRVRTDGGRSLYSVDWTTTSKMRDDYIYHYPATHKMQVLMSVCRTARLDLLHIFLRDRIVKFPAWNPDFKLQSLFWLEGISEAFVNAVEWWWLEGVYWRFSVHVPRDSGQKPEVCSEEKTTAAWARKVETFWEDELALEIELHKYASAEYMYGDGFVLRVDYAAQMERFAIKAGAEVLELMSGILKRKKGVERLTRAEVRKVLARAALCAEEQLSVQLYSVPQKGRDDLDPALLN